MAGELDEKVPGEDPVVARARKRFQQAIDAEDENRAKELDDMKFLASTPDDNYQWPTEILRQRQKPGEEGGIRPCLTINKLRSHHNQVLNEQRMNRPQILVRPGDSKASAEVAEVLNGWMRHIQVASEADLAYDTACQWQTGGGVGYFRMYTAYCDEKSFDQDVVFERCPDRMQVYLDPIGLKLHPAGKKCRWGFIVEDLPKDEYEETYGKENEVDWNLAGAGDMQHWFPSKETVRVAEYFEIREKDATICAWDVPKEQGGTDRVVTVKGSPEDVQYTQAGYQKVNERATKLPRCWWIRMNGQKVISKAKEMPTKYVPIIRVVGNEWMLEGKTLVDGMVRPAKDAQRMYNYNASVEIEVNALQPKAPITAMVEQIKGHEDRYRQVNLVPLGYLPYNAVYNEDGTIANVSPPQRIAPPVPPMAHIQAKIGADADIKATMGQWGPSLGEPSNEKSGKAITARQRESDVGTFHYIDNLARALRYAGLIALDMAAEIIDEKRVVRILGEDGEPDHIVVDPELPVPYKEEQGPDGKKVCLYNFALGKYDVVVNTGPSFTTKRAEAAEFLTTAVQAAKDPATAAVLNYLALKNQDWSGAEEAVTLLKSLLPPPAQQALASENDEQPQVPPQVQATIDQLKGQLGHTAGQLQAALQAVQEREQELAKVKQDAANADSAGKAAEASARLEAEREKAKAAIAKAEAEVQKARLELARAQAEAETAAHQVSVAQQGEMDRTKMSVAPFEKVAATLDTIMQALTALHSGKGKEKVIEITAPSGGVYTSRIRHE